MPLSLETRCDNASLSLYCCVILPVPYREGMGESTIAIGHIRTADVAARASARSVADRVTLGGVIIGAFAVVLLSLPYKAFDLDRFFVPKELVLHATAAITGVFVLARRPRPALSRV